MNGHSAISRTGERVLGIIGIIFNILAIILLVVMINSLDDFQGSQFQEEMEREVYNDPALTPEDAEMTIEMLNNSVGVFGTFGWVMVVMLAVSTLLAIFAITKLKNNANAKLAGILFIIAGLLAGILSLTAILFYIAAIMCFVRKPPMREDDLLRSDDAVRREEDSPYRPL